MTIKPCPFCGSLQVHVFAVAAGYDDQEYLFHRVECTECYAKGPVPSTQEKAIEMWNNRSESE